MSAVASGLRAAAAALLLVAGALPATGAIVQAADVSFGTPEAAVTYDTSIVFSVPFTAASRVARVELRLGFPDSLGPYIVDVPAPASGGTHTLRYTLDLTGDGHLVPNTPIDVTWAAVSADGTETTSRAQTVLYADTSHTWRTVSGSLVTVHWYDGTQAFAERALEIGEKAIRDTSALLGVTESAKVDFFIYGDDTSFRDALGPGTRENVGGQAHSDIRTLFALITPDTINDPWVGIVIPHELVHLVFDTAVRNPYRFPPRWFNEGLAVYLSEGFTSSDRGLVQDAVRTQDLIPLDALGGQFPTDAQKTYLAYAESVSAIDYLVRTDGKDALLGLVKAYKDGLTDDEAFGRALGRNLATFQSGWLADLGASAPTRYGPQAAPAGPLPSGWTGPGQTFAPGAPSAAPGATASGTTDGPRPAATGTETDTRGLVVLAIVVAVVAVAIGLLLARRRSPDR